VPSSVPQDVDIWFASIEAGQRRVWQLQPHRQAWLHVAEGAVALYGQDLREGDGAALKGSQSLALTANPGAKVLIFDLQEQDR
jgi:redox-sensitive bicupin YhaK (pirin superfamily)